jgi:hypothetical protein
MGNNTAGIAVDTIFREPIIVGLCSHLRTLECWGERARASWSRFFGLLILITNTKIVMGLV